MPKQSLDLIDYVGPLAAWIVFFSVIFIISVTCILWCCVSEQDDATVFAKWGMGPRRRSRPAAGSQHGGGFIAGQQRAGGPATAEGKAE